MSLFEDLKWKIEDTLNDIKHKVDDSTYDIKLELENIKDRWDIASADAEVQRSNEEYTKELENKRKNNKEISRGMVLGVSRGFYKHYGVYIGNDEIIAYTSKDSDTSSENTIMKTKMSHFLKDADEFHILRFHDEFKRGSNVSSSIAATGISIHLYMQETKLKEQYKIQTKEQCAKRAESKLANKGYSLSKNNCEHFSIWCKTNIHLSIQTDLSHAGIEVSRVVPSNKYIPL